MENTLILDSNNSVILDPYQNIIFEDKHVQIIDKEGNIIFNENIMFPNFFDDNSAKIVSSKYLLNTAKKKEKSLKELIDRVSDQISSWTLKDKYFTELENPLFTYKLKYYQINQYFAFNSPVYFNCGLSEKPQCSACFILSMEDEMSSISDCLSIESEIFKNGSGSGINMSKIRSSKETVKGSGLASGPCSFLKSADINAGVIKSGGTLRRSAKLVVLDIDHPDIMKFIRCKELEERKLKALQEAGVEAESGYEMTDHVFYQNTNLSVRLKKDFMDAVEINNGYYTKYIRTGEKCERFKARDLLKEMAEMAWKTGCPGVQYADNINLWNTCKSSGEILSSNPCGEFMALDNLSCNLASLNLIKFFSSESDNTIRFDHDIFEDVIKNIITAQDSLIDNSSYPSRKITNNSHNFRPLGLGYSNLGALLMWLGLAYDSEEGRDIASLLTSIMTGIAYKTSKELADKLGGFSKFKENKQSFYTVLEKHNSHTKSLVDYLKTKISKNRYLILNLCDKALTVWEEIFKYISEEKEFRNSQVTLLAPTGTISFLMMCATTGIEPDYSLIKFKTLSGNNGSVMKMINPLVKDSLKNLGYDNVEINNLESELLSKNHFENSNILKKEHLSIFDTAMVPSGGKRCIDYMGHVKMCAAVQPFLSGAISKCVSGDTIITTENGLIPIEKFHNKNQLPDTFVDLNLKVDTYNGHNIADKFYYNGKQNTIKLNLKDGRTIQGTINHKLLVADGKSVNWKKLSDISKSDFIAIKIGSNLWSQEDVSIKFDQLNYNNIQKQIKIPDKMNRDIARFMGYVISDGYLSNSVHTLIITKNDKKVLNNCERIVYENFGIHGIIKKDHHGTDTYSVSSKSLLKLLSYLGCSGKAGTKEIPWSILQSTEECIQEFIGGLWLDGYVSKKSKVAICLKSEKLIKQLQIVLNNFGILNWITEKYNYEYKTYYYDLAINGEHIPLFASLIKLDQEYKLTSLIESVNKRNSIKNCSTAYKFPCYKDKMIEEARNHRELSKWKSSLCDPNTTFISYITAKKFYEKYNFKLISEIIENKIYFVPICSIESIENIDVYDFHVPSNNSFIGNGIVNHNTINMPNDCKVEDIYNLYIEGWKLGLKGLTIYRDGSKNAQPLSNTTIKAKKLLELPPRKRVPNTAMAIRHKFIVNSDLDVYVIVGLFEDGSPGELFIELSKEGSTISGLFDSLAVTVSLALQFTHGKILKSLVAKMINQRFEPAGFIQSDTDIKTSTSIVDYIFKWLGVNYLNDEDKEELGLLNYRKTSNSFVQRNEEIKIEKKLETIRISGITCNKCGTLMVRKGSCMWCDNCGQNSGSCG